MGPRVRQKPRGPPVASAASSAPARISVSDKMVNQPTHRRFQPIFSATTAFSILLVLRLFSAAFATIPDCDEVFNYWEPTHYLSHGYGLQTWEYSPVYAIRSWAYVGLHAILSRGFSLLPHLSKIHEFYGLRALFAAFCAYCEAKLYVALSVNINRRVGLLYLIASMSSSGMFHAAASFLPSTFAMYTTMLGLAAFMNRRCKPFGSTAVADLMWFALGGFLGWPFSLAMCAPCVLEDLLVGVVSGTGRQTIVRLAKGGAAALLLLGAIVAVDSMAYTRFEIVPLNIVLYNVFGGEGKGPDLYGTEPWWFYVANLTLNFNILFPLAMIAGPLLILYYLGCGDISPVSTPRMFIISIPFYLWFSIFTAQPHKEERFMFVAYPALCINAAIAFHIILTVWGGLSHRLTSGRPQELLNWTVLVLPLMATALISLSRSLAIVTAYSAPMDVYSAFPSNATGNLCLGKEWYRFPSSYFLPNGVRAKFIKSAFDGLLPGEFPEILSGWKRPGTWMVPERMNDMNIGDPSKYTTFDSCDYLVESYFDRDEPSEEDYHPDTMDWDELRCDDFLDAGKTATLGRVLWVPKWVPNARRWGRYCMYARKQRADKEIPLA